MSSTVHTAQAGRSRLALGCGVAVLLSALAAFVLGSGLEGTVLISAVTAVGYGSAGALLASARPSNPLGWLLLVIGALNGATSALATWAASPHSVDMGGQVAAAWLSSWLWFPGFALVPTLLLVLYPNGKLGGRARGLLAAAAVFGTAGVSTALALSPTGIDDHVPGLVNPVAVEPVSIAAAVVGFAVLLPSVLLALADAVRRLRRASSPEREQLAWLLITVVVFVVGSYTPWVGGRAGVQTLVPVAVAVGVLRHRLLDLQVVVRRTLLFTGLTLAVVLVFAVSTAALSGVVDGGPLPVAVSAALVAVGLTPVRERLQRGVDRLVYGDRQDPVRAVATLGRHVAEHGDAALVQQVLYTVAAAVRSPCVVLHDPEGVVQARAGATAGGTPQRLPLQVAGGEVGCLLVWPRTPRDGWTRGDGELLSVLTQQVAIVAHAGQLNAELARSRDGVLAATADERYRLRQELHDGLGPALSGIALGLEAAEAAQRRSPERTGELLGRLRQETQAASREVKRLVEGLRPAALDGQGLDEALHAFVDGLAAVARGRLALSLDVPEPLPALGPDVDSTAYRIVTEAVHNVVRHSGAGSCHVEVVVRDGALRVTVQDDGIGLPAQPRDGVGLVSMRRRAAALGGSWSVRTPRGGGTRVLVELPVQQSVGTATLVNETEVPA
jgi:signal transduction histidine kinase